MYIFLSRRKKRKGFLKQNDEKLRYAIVDYHSSLWCYFQILDFYCTVILFEKSRLVLILVRHSLEVGCILLNNQHTKKWNKMRFCDPFGNELKFILTAKFLAVDPIYNLFHFLILIETHGLQLNLEDEERCIARLLSFYPSHHFLLLLA